MDSEYDSNSESSDDSDQLDRQSWNDPNTNDDTCKIQFDWELLGPCSKQVVCPASVHDSQNDDVLLWSQQPRVLSVKQAQTLLVEAFG